MKKPLFILVVGLFLAAGAYAAFFFARTNSGYAADASELSWLRQEFSLSDQEFARIRELHEGYLPDCAAMCERIAAANRDLEQLVLSTNTVTPQISEKLAEISRIRQECQTRMLKHFYAVSQAMPAAQGRRYLAEMQRLTSLSNMRDHSTTNTAQREHGHRM
jgi:hypothetical protein